MFTSARTAAPRWLAVIASTALAATTAVLPAASGPSAGLSSAGPSAGPSAPSPARPDVDPRRRSPIRSPSSCPFPLIRSGLPAA